VSSTATISTQYGTYTVHRDAPHRAAPYALFLAGGPGLSVAPERELLSPALRRHVNLLWLDQLGSAGAPAITPDLITWPNVADDLATIIRSETDGAVHLIAHSGGSLASFHLFQRHPDTVRSVTWSAPVAHLAPCFAQMLRAQVAAGQLSRAALDAGAADALDHLLAASGHRWTRREVGQLAGLLPCIGDVFGIYWKDRGARARYDAACPPGHLAVPAFLALAGEGVEAGLAAPPGFSGIPALAVPGGADVVAPWSLNRPAFEAAIANLAVAPLAGTGHFPHIEATEDFVQTWATHALNPQI
jgi:pimeloyl-ACP methyl ester carboxylesterase